MRFCIMLAFMTSFTHLTSQRFEDGFERVDLSDWDIISGEAILTTSPIVEGVQSVRLRAANGDTEGVMIHRSLLDSYGRYQYFTRVTGPDSESDFYFQYLDEDNHFVISHKPTNGNLPEFSLSRVYQGQFTELQNIPPVAATNEWIKVDVERLCDGQILIYVDDVLSVQSSDIDLIDDGTIGLRAVSQFTYFDSITFVPALPVYDSPNPEIIQTCTGSGFAFGNSIYTMNGIYTDTLSTTLGCDSIVTIDLEFVTEITIDTLYSVCSGDSVHVGDTYYSLPGSYIDTFATSFGCDSIVSFDLEFISEILSDTLYRVCFGDSVLVGTVYYSMPGSYVDTFATALGCDSIVTSHVEFISEILSDTLYSICSGDSILVGNVYVSIPGIYVDTFATSLGCDSIVTVELAFEEETIIDTVFSVCVGDSILVGNTYYSIPNTYVEVLTSTAGCDSTIQFELRNSQQLFFNRDTTLCIGDTLIINNQAITSNTVAMDTLSTSGCDSVITWNVTFDRDSLNLGADLLLCSGETIILNAGPYATYLWNDNSTSPSLLISMPGDYNLTVENSNGCILTDAITVVEGCELAFAAPNIFSPNNDAINDTWGPSFNRAPLIYNLIIMDRWGSIVFQSNNPTEEWTGENNGRPATNGVYRFMIRADDVDYVGDITIIR